MSHTEAQASTLWCPKAIVAFGNGAVSGNRGFGNHPLADDANCLGSKCMAWRWSRAKETKAYLDAVQAHMKETGDNFNIATNKVWAQIGSTFERTEGYCGLAGRPE